MSDPEHLSESQIFAYLDGELSRAEGQSVSRHLASCPRCAEKRAEAQALFKSIEQLPEIPLELDLASGVLAEIRAREQPALADRLFYPALVLQLVLALLILSSSPAAVLARLITPLEQIGQYSRDMAARLPRITAWIETALQLLSDELLASADFLSRPMPIPFSLIALVPLVVSCFVLWLVGNGVLLGQARLGRRR